LKNIIILPQRRGLGRLEAGAGDRPAGSGRNAFCGEWRLHSLLEEVYQEGRYREEIAKILELDRIYRKATGPIIKKYFSGEKPQLTAQEQTIAELAATRLTNGEIGIRLFISPNTVKARLKSVFEKRDINIISRFICHIYSAKVELYTDKA
jgi:DNA-binding CsgD family transcriptional regulator